MKIRQKIDDKLVPSLTEWMEKIHISAVKEFRKEDNTKRKRLRSLAKILNIKVEKVHELTAKEIINRTPNFLSVLRKRRLHKCSLRLVPLNHDLPKLRVEKKNLNQNLLWFRKQHLDPRYYRVEVLPHHEKVFLSAIFIINELGIFGEVIKGAHKQLTQGIHECRPCVFAYDYKRWHFSSMEKKYVDFIKKTISKLYIKDRRTKILLKSKLNINCTKQNFLKGYYETVLLQKSGIIFIDFNRTLYRMMKKVSILIKQTSNLKGLCASPGKAKGIIKIIDDHQKNKNFKKDEILVCKITTIRHLPLMKRAKAIITEQGNILSHPAIVSRELKKPHLVMVKDATKHLHTGDIVQVNASKGTIHHIT